MILPSPAKLNLFLYINGRREDGYHELQTLFQFLDFGDEIDIEVTQAGEIELLTQIENVPTEQNLICKAAKLLQNHTAYKQKSKYSKLGARIKIIKNLPMGGGVGGGSSNAATVLVGLNHLWHLGLSLQELAKLGLTLGADVPIFVQGRAAFAEGIGEKLTYCELAQKWYLVLKPNVSISTATIFNDAHLPRNTPKRSLKTLLSQKWENDCEKIVKDHYFEIEKLLHWLVQYAPARLTGTGACVFAEFESKEEAEKVFLLKPIGVEGFVAQGKNISSLHQQLNLFS